MRKLLSATTLAAALALGGAAWAQSGAPAATGGPNQSGANRPTMAPSQPPLGQQTSGTMSEEQVRTKLSAQGFQNVENMTRSGNSYHARAMQNGRSVDVTIDAATGTISSQAAAR